MNHFKGVINLLQFPGAEVRTLEVNGTSKEVICIPAEYCEAYITRDKQSAIPLSAYVSLRGWLTGENFRQACIQRNTGKENYTPPSHQLSLSFSENYQKKAEEIICQRLRNNPEYMKNNPTDEDIRKAAHIEMVNKIRIGTLTPMGSASPTSETPVDASTSATPDDLPF